MNLIREAIYLICWIIGLIFTLIIWFTVPFVQQEVDLLLALIIIPVVPIMTFGLFFENMLNNIYVSQHSGDGVKK